MIDITIRHRELLLIAAMTLCATAASAQSGATAASAQSAPGRKPSEIPSWESAVRGSYLLHSCRTGRGLSLCLGEEDDAPSAFAARFDKFTRLAGMFMGRVEAVTVCGMRLHLKLEIL